MKRLLLNLMVLLTTSLLGVGVSRLASFYPFPAIPDALFASPQSLKLVGGMDACGPDANYHVYQLSDGTGISISCEHLSSPEASNRALQNRLGTATEVISREPNLDGNGHSIGETVLAKSGGIVRLRTQNGNFCSIEAASLKHLQWLDHR